MIDTEAISEVCDKFGVKEHEVHNALLSGDPHDQLAIAYHLIIDNKRIADEAAKAEIKDFYVASKLHKTQFMYLSYIPLFSGMHKSYFHLTTDITEHLRHTMSTGRIV